MKNKKIWLKMLVMALIFGMITVSCSSDDGDTNLLDTLGLNPAAPSAAALNAGGLTQAQFDQIRFAAGGGFQGWVITDEGYLMMVWTGRSVANFTSTANTLRNMFGESSIDTGEGGLFAFGGRYILIFFSASFSYDGYYLPAETMTLSIWRP